MTEQERQAYIEKATDRLQSDEAKEAKNAHDLGFVWAAEKATRKQLRAIAGWRNCCGEIRIAPDILPQTVEEDPAEFWSYSLGDDYGDVSGVFASAFATGAAELWDAIQEEF